MTSNISFEKAKSNVEYFLEIDKGKVRITKVMKGYTCWANSVKVLQQYANSTLSVPTLAEEAKKVLSRINEELYNGKE